MIFFGEQMPRGNRRVNPWVAGFRGDRVYSGRSIAPLLDGLPPLEGLGGRQTSCRVLRNLALAVVSPYAARSAHGWPPSDCRPGAPAVTESGGASAGIGSRRPAEQESADRGEDPSSLAVWGEGMWQAAVPQFESWSTLSMFRLIRLRPGRKLDSDITRAASLPVDKALQKRAMRLIRRGEIERAIDEVRAETRYDRHDARSVVLALMHGVKVPTVKP